jgi:hypothetical protein
MSCYSYKIIKETVDPVLKNVDITIILIMENSTRFKYDPFILNLSKKTVFQYNKGFRACRKPSTIVKTNSDIVHAYYTAFEYSKNMNNVIILEEDAEVLYYTKSHYEIVDKYISGTFKIFSFANYGKFTKINENFYKSSIICGAHAQIISKAHRHTLTQKIKLNNFNGHIDADYFCDDVVVYKYPLIVQLFMETENRQTWNSNKIISDFFINLIELDKNKSAWEIIYLISKLNGNITNVLILIILFIVLIICRK